MLQRILSGWLDITNPWQLTQRGNRNQPILVGLVAAQPLNVIKR
jgi:hypothetical protein